MNEILSLQHSLKLIRKVAGWTAEDFCKMIGITRPTLSKMEKSEVEVLSRTQYIAIRKLIDYEVRNNDNELLDTVMRVCVDNDYVTEDDINKVNDFVKKAKKGGIDNAIIAAGIAGIIGMTFAAIMKKSSPDWFDKLLNDVK